MRVLSIQQLAFERGRKLYLKGGACPSKPPDDMEDLDQNAWSWVGWRLEFALDWTERQRVARMLNMPEPEIPWLPSGSKPL